MTDTVSEGLIQGRCESPQVKDQRHKVEQLNPNSIKTTQSVHHHISFFAHTAYWSRKVQPAQLFSIPFIFQFHQPRLVLTPDNNPVILQSHASSVEL